MIKVLNENKSYHKIKVTNCKGNDSGIDLRYLLRDPKNFQKIQNIPKNQSFFIGTWTP